MSAYSAPEQAVVVVGDRDRKGAGAARVGRRTRPHPGGSPLWLMPTTRRCAQVRAVHRSGGRARHGGTRRRGPASMVAPGLAVNSSVVAGAAHSVEHE